MYLVVKDTDARFVLCNDNKWRRDFTWGCCSGCAKEYRSATWALKKARRIGGMVYEEKHWNEVVGQWCR